MTFFMELRRREEKGRAEGRWVTLVELVHDGLLTVKEAAKRASMSEEAFRKLVTR